MASDTLGAPATHGAVTATPAGAAPGDGALFQTDDPSSADALASSAETDRLIEAARDYARAAASENTLAAYAADWEHYARFLRQRGAPSLPPSPELVGLYVTACASGQFGRRASVATLERRISGIAFAYRQRGHALDRRTRAIASVMAGIRRRHGQPPKRKEPVSPGGLLAMAATLNTRLSGMRDRAMLMLGYAGALRRSEIVGLDVREGGSEDGTGWIEILEPGAVLRINGKTGWREVEVGRGRAKATCPVAATETWLDFAKLKTGPLFVRTSTRGDAVLGDRLSPEHVALLVKRTAKAAGLRPELTEAERHAAFSGHSLRSGLASYAEAEERHVQKQLGHATAEMTRRYQRRKERFRVNLTQSAGW